jgi:hypothetical protein
VSGLYYVQSGNGSTWRAARSYKKPNEAKQAAVKIFNEYEDLLLRYDKVGHTNLKEVCRQIDGINADAGYLGENSDWSNSSRDRPMEWSCDVGWGVHLTVRIWKAS